MRRSPMILAVITSAVALMGCATHDVADRDERDAILATLNSWNAGWQSRDAAVAVADYAEDADWTNAFGDRFRGRAELQEGLEFIFSLDFVMAGASAGNEYADITMLSDDVALIRSQLTRAGQETDSGAIMNDRSINHLRVLQKRDGRWVIVSHLISQAKEKGSL